jgi:hypothetical protein
MQGRKLGRCCSGAGTVVIKIYQEKSGISNPIEQSNMNKVIVPLAEAGVNHNGDIQVAKSDVAVDAGVDYVKISDF